jgi:hypothetical protein
VSCLPVFTQDLDGCVSFGQFRISRSNFILAQGCRLSLPPASAR